MYLSALQHPIECFLRRVPWDICAMDLIIQRSTHCELHNEAYIGRFFVVNSIKFYDILMVFVE